MSNLDYMDLEILYQAKKSKNGINPEALSQQDVFTPGVWELVDKFAALQEKNLLTKNKEGLFVLTKSGMNTFWNIVSLMVKFVETITSEVIFGYRMCKIS